MWHWTKAVIHFSPITFWYISPKDVKNIPHPNLLDASFAVGLRKAEINIPTV